MNKIPRADPLTPTLSPRSRSWELFLGAGSLTEPRPRIRRNKLQRRWQKLQIRQCKNVQFILEMGERATREDEGSRGEVTRRGSCDVATSARICLSYNN